MSRIMGLDVGDRTIGIAISDENKRIALPYENYFRTSNKNDVNYILELCVEKNVVTIVSGLPYNMNGTLGPQAEKTKNFLKLLEKKFKYSDRIESTINIILWDERLTSMAAEKVMIAANLSREKRKKNIDKIAGTFILQGYLDYYNGGM